MYQFISWPHRWGYLFSGRILALLVLVTGAVACRKKAVTTQVMTRKMTESVYASGVIKSKNQYQVYATVAGLIQQVVVKEGDLVHKGDPLMMIRNDASRLQSENAQLSADFANWNTSGDRLSELKGVIETARAKMLNDSLLLVRQRGLWAQQIGAKIELEQRELAYTNAVAAHQAAIFRYNDLQRQLRFAADQSRKLLSISQNNVQDFIVRSQIDGKVYSLNKVAGEIVNSQMPLAVIGSATGFEAELQVDEKDIARIRSGLPVLLTLDSYQKQVFEATVTRINPIMNERTRSFTVAADFVQQPPVLYPFLTAEANILLQTKAQALTIPREYLIEDSLVLTAPDQRQRVQTGLKDYSRIEIVQGLTDGQTIFKPLN